ncbi:hypothetical protein GVN16_03330 [Emticicia sp. CRIBPO]|nr:hypothetical protein [Emticicia sp. CRIBPO]
MHIAISLFIPIILYRFDEGMKIARLKDETWVYLILSSGVIISIACRKLIVALINRFHNSGEDIKIFENELTNYMLSEANIKLMIYFFYLVYLIVFNTLIFQGRSYFSNPNIDKAILQSFVTFIAFERIIVNLKVLEFRPSKLLKYLKDSLTNN